MIKTAKKLAYLFTGSLLSINLKALEIISIKRDSRAEARIKAENKNLEILCLDLAKKIIPVGYPNLDSMQIVNDFDQDQTFLIFEVLSWNQVTLAKVKYELTRAGETLAKSSGSKQKIKELNNLFEEAYGSFLEESSIVNLENVLIVSIKQAKLVQAYFSKKIIVEQNSPEQISFYVNECPESILGTASIITILPKLILETRLSNHEFLKMIQKIECQTSRSKKVLVEAAIGFLAPPSLLDYCANFLMRHKLI